MDKNGKKALVIIISTMVIIVIATFIFVAGIFFFVNKNVNKYIFTTPETQEMYADADVDGYKRYENDNVSFLYPSNWEVAETDEVIAIIDTSSEHVNLNNIQITTYTDEETGLYLDDFGFIRRHSFGINISKGENHSVSAYKSIYINDIYTEMTYEYVDDLEDIIVLEYISYYEDGRILRTYIYTHNQSQLDIIAGSLTIK